MTRRAPRAIALICLLFVSAGEARAAPDDRLEVFPPAIVLDGPDARQQVVVSLAAGVSEGRLDVTGRARIVVEPPDLATIDASGVVRPSREGAGTLRVEFQGVSPAVARLRVGKLGHPEPVSYRHEVSAVLSRAGCNMGACHGNLNGKGGFKLSLRGEDAAFDHASITRDLQGRRISPLAPAASLLVAKPLGTISHEGGRRIPLGSPEALILARWVAEGAVDDEAARPRLDSLAVFPSDRLVAAPGLEQQIAVTASFSDGTTRDVTHLATFDVDDPASTRADSRGIVARSAPGESVVAIRYLDGRATARLAFLADRPAFAWNGPEPRTPLDVAVFERLRALRINLSPAAPPHVLLRRLHLDLTGVLPTADEARAYLDDPSEARTDELIARLLDRPEFADYWALKWSDLLKNEEKAMGPKGVWALQRWLRDQVAADRPMTEIAAALVASSGSTWQNPAASFHRTNRDPESTAESFSQVFLGVRMQCARCHNHPFDVWTQDDYFGLAATFSNIGRKQVNNVRRDKFDAHENNGDELISVSSRQPSMRSPRTGARLAPAPPGEAPLDLGPGPDARDELAAWLTRDNRQFARNMANRVWFHLIGRGVVEPVDDFRGSNPPSNPELLEELTDAFIAGGYRLKPLVSLIARSEVYRLDSTPDETNRDDPIHPSRARVRPLPAEVLLDAVASATGHRPGFPSAPDDARAAQLGGVQAGTDFLKVFGKPERLLACECERSESTTLAQAFQLINGEILRESLAAKGNAIDRLIAAGATDEAMLEDLYLASLTRRPTDEERSAALGHVFGAGERREAWEDVVWALVNSKEFLLRR